MENGTDIKDTLQSIDATLKRIEQIIRAKAKVDSDTILGEIAERLEGTIKHF